MASWTSDGGLVATCDGYNVWVWNPTTHRVVGEMSTPWGSLTDIAWVEGPGIVFDRLKCS